MAAVQRPGRAQAARSTATMGEVVMGVVLGAVLVMLVLVLVSQHEGMSTMSTRNCVVTPLAAVAAGLLAGGVGTVCLDTVHYLEQRRAGGAESPLSWEFAPIDGWEKAPAPGQVAKRLIEGFTQRELPDRWAWVTSTAAHWGYGSLAGAVYGATAGSLRRPHALYGVPFGAAVFAGDYIALPLAGLYQPIWENDAKTLAWDLAAHLAYGAATGTTFWLLTKLL